MSNSSLVSYTLISPNKNVGNYKKDTVTIHCMAGQLTVEQCGKLFANKSRQASSNYGIGYDGRIGLYVEEKDRSWATSSKANDIRAITIEVASDAKAPYKITDAAYKSLINLLVDICKRNPSIGRLKWQGNKALIGQIAKQNMTVHRWFANKACPGDYLYNLHGQIAAEVNARLDAENKPKPAPSTGTIPTVTYRVYANGKWLSEVKNDSDYAGMENIPILGIMVKSNIGKISVRVRLKGNKSWLGWVTGYNPNDYKNGYAGNLKNTIDRIQIKLEGVGNKDVFYNVSVLDSKGYLGWVRGTTDYAGSIAAVNGKPIDKVIIKISDKK